MSEKSTEETARWKVQVEGIPSDVDKINYWFPDGDVHAIKLESYLGRRVNVAGLCRGSERERFTRTANSAEAAGADARHGFGKFVPPNEPLTLKDAHSFLQGMFLKVVLMAAARSNGLR